jgi:long-chain acyl-CoA synthetase
MAAKKTLFQLFQQYSERNSLVDAIGEFRHEQVLNCSTHEYINRLQRIGAGLISLGLKPGDCIAIIGKTSFNWHLIDLAAMMMGIIIAPIFPGLNESDTLAQLGICQPQAIAFADRSDFKIISPWILEHQDLKLIHINTGQADTFAPALNITNLGELIDSDALQIEAYIKLCHDVSDETEATIIFTSGTTGDFRGVVHTHSSIFSSLRSIKLTIKEMVDKQDTTVCFLPLAHVLGRFQSLVHLTLSNKIIFYDHPENLLPALKACRPTFLITVPRILEIIQEQIEHSRRHFIGRKAFGLSQKISKLFYSSIDQDHSPGMSTQILHEISQKLILSNVHEQLGGQIRFLVSGGAALPSKTFTFYRSLGFTVLEGYGLTETFGPCTLNRFTRQRSEHVGPPLEEHQICLAEDGEILIKSPAIFKHYHRDNEASLLAIQNGWLHSGDIGEFDEFGSLKIIDRKKDLIVLSSGKVVSPQKIEKILRTLPYIEQCLVIDNSQSQLVAIIGLEREAFSPLLAELGLKNPVDLQELAENQKVREIVAHSVNAANSHLSHHEQIRRFIIAPIELDQANGFLTPSLKLKKRAILSKFSREINAI